MGFDGPQPHVGRGHGFAVLRGPDEVVDVDHGVVLVVLRVGGPAGVLLPHVVGGGTSPLGQHLSRVLVGREAGLGLDTT